MDSTDDSTWLREYAENRSDEAFAALVNRHINLVYSVALRHVGDPHQAEEIAQSVFILLAKKAAQLRHDKALSSWLFQATRLTASNLVRSENRRRHREQEAHMQSLLDESGTDLWQQIRPLLDDAVADLSEADRQAIVLRFYEGRNLRDVGAALGASEDAAEKRVNRALERLRAFFAKRGVTIGASSLAVVLSANAVQAAPAGLAVTISTAAALGGTTIAASATGTATKAIAMTTLQKTIIGATLTVAVGVGVYEASQASALRSQVQTLRQEQAEPLEQIQQLTGERDDAARHLVALRDEHERLVRNNAELARLNDEVVRLRREAQKFGRFPATNEAMDSLTEKWLKRVNELKQLVEQRPELRIPELQFLTADDWLRIAQRLQADTEEGIRATLAEVRHSAKNHLSSRMGRALIDYIAANNGQLPSDILQLKPYFNSPVDGVMLQRYKVQCTGRLNEYSLSEPLIVETAPVDDEYDYLVRITASGDSCRGIGKLTGGGSSSTWGTNLDARIKPFTK